MTGPAAYLHNRVLLRLLAVQALVILPLLAQLKPWLWLAVPALLLWRAWASHRGHTLPPKTFKWAVTIASVVGLLLSYGRLHGQEAGAALLTTMTALKSLELQSRRDVMVNVFLLYALCGVSFLFTQELYALPLLLAAVVLITGILIDSQHPGEPLPFKPVLRRSAVMVVQALPLMLALFVLFPRLPGPLWGLPTDAHSGLTGLSDQMSPGDIANLMESDELAFRVRFFGAVPTASQRYWRGPVFWNFDGRTWREGGGAALQQESEAIAGRGAELNYEITLEPQAARWVTALEHPVGELPEGLQRGAGLSITAEKPLTERKLYRLSARPAALIGGNLGPQRRDLALYLPLRRNPQTLALAQQWRAEAGSDAAMASKVLQHFRQEKFRYTLRPPPLGNQPVDEFLFGTRAGFCEHYSSAFVVLMRAAGIPARVVTGYQGGAYIPEGDFWEIRSRDAHAWAEVWIDGRWQRVDPTAAVAPERVERNLEAALGAREALPGWGRSDWSDAIARRWAVVNAKWDRWVLAYGPERQQELLSRFGLDELQDLLIALTATVALLLLLLGAYLWWRNLPKTRLDRAQKAWLRAIRPLARKPWRLQPRPHEGAMDFAQRASQQLTPLAAAALADVARAYGALRYASADAPPSTADIQRAGTALSAALRGSVARAGGVGP